jgi:hypothetical protein
MSVKTGDRVGNFLITTYNYSAELIRDYVIPKSEIEFE